MQIASRCASFSQLLRIFKCKGFGILDPFWCPSKGALFCKAGVLSTSLRAADFSCRARAFRRMIPRMWFERWDVLTVLWRELFVRYVVQVGHRLELF